MTLIIGASTKDYIVIVGDGLASDMDNRLLNNRNFPKVYALDNTLHFGLAGKGFNIFDINALTNGIRQAINFTPPFTVYDKAIEFGDFARSLFRGRPETELDFIFGGFNCNRQGEYTNSRLFFMSSDNNFAPLSKRGKQVYYAPSNSPNFLVGHKMLNDSEYLKKQLCGALKYVADNHDMIGGIANGVAISRPANEWFISDLDA